MTTISPVTPSDKAAVDQMLGLAQLPITTDEYERLVRWYPFVQEQTAALRIPEVRYGEPADVYPALGRA
jgi:hypothetical protein